MNQQTPNCSAPCRNPNHGEALLARAGAPRFTIPCKAPVKLLSRIRNLWTLIPTARALSEHALCLCFVRVVGSAARNFRAFSCEILGNNSNHARIIYRLVGRGAQCWNDNIDGECMLTSHESITVKPVSFRNYMIRPGIPMCMFVLCDSAMLAYLGW